MKQLITASMNQSQCCGYYQHQKISFVSLAVGYSFWCRKFLREHTKLTRAALCVQLGKVRTYECCIVG